MGYLQRIRAHHKALYPHCDHCQPSVVCLFLEHISKAIWTDTSLYNCRLLEYAKSYFDLANFPAGEARRALQSVYNKTKGKGRVDESSNADEKKSYPNGRKSKKIKKE